MALFDSKQEVINIELTSLGKSKMATGGFKPAYYAFFDDGVIYDGAYADITESFNGEADIRVRTETPYLRSQASLIGQEFKKIKNPSIKETNEFNNIIKYENENLLKHYLGNTSIGQQTGSRVGMMFLEGEIEDVSLTGTLNKFDGREGYNSKRNKITTKTLLFTPEIKNLTNPNLNVPPEIIDWAGLNIFIKLQVLAQRTAEMHIALGSEFEDTAFTPTHFNGDYEVWLKNRLLYQFQNRLNTVENNLHRLEGLSLDLAKEFLERKNEIRKRFVTFDWTKLKGERIRVHGDYHLGQVLVKDDDFYLLDFEGEPESTIRDRKVKQPPLKDIAGLFRSFHYAVYATIFNHMEEYAYSQEDLFLAGEILYRYFIGVFLETYASLIQEHNINIGYRQERIFLLEYCMLEKAVYELGYEMNSRPRWAVIPLQGIMSIINEPK